MRANWLMFGIIACFAGDTEVKNGQRVLEADAVTLFMEPANTDLRIKGMMGTLQIEKVEMKTHVVGDGSGKKGE